MGGEEIGGNNDGDIGETGEGEEVSESEYELDDKRGVNGGDNKSDRCLTERGRDARVGRIRCFFGFGFLTCACSTTVVVSVAASVGAFVEEVVEGGIDEEEE